jgi:uncharacterized protein YoxC
MKEIPAIWFWLSGAFFVANMVMFVAMGIAMFRISKVVQELKPKVDETLEKVQVTSAKVEELATQAKATLDELNSKAKSVSNTAEIVVQTASQQMGKFSPVIAVAVTAFRIFAAYRQSREAKKQPKKGLIQSAPKRASAIADLLQAIVKLKG